MFLPRQFKLNRKVPIMYKHKTCPDIKNNAKIKLSNSYVIATMATFILFSIYICFSFFSYTINISISDIGDSQIYKLIFDEIISLSVATLLGVFNVGFAFFFLNIACKGSASINDIFSAPTANFKKSLQLSFILAGVHTVCSLSYRLYEFKTITGNSENFAKYLILIICVLINIVVNLHLSQIYYLMLDFPDYSVLEIINLSINKMRGNCFRYFKLLLSFIPLFILGILSYGIGYLWIVPYLHASKVEFFLDLMNPDNA